ncbi:MAG TPA: tRNA (N6-threonylcarbamoyladenosine(37)-N6)-methyltransferase TrmO [bacterium]|nr:tRNA (N6-threonylcarbamoyladenosine(37)-N6)-methyltransferase TrmO [bacterium]
MDSITLTPIGIVHSPHKQPQGTPIQPCFARGVEGEIEIFPAYAAGLKDVDGFSHLHVIYYFHLAKGYELTATPYADTVPRGLFAIRSPRRPNPLGLSVVRVRGVEGNRLLVAEIDMLDGTPVLDLKPFNPAMDHRDDCRIGWMENRWRADRPLADDGRFAKK